MSSTSEYAAAWPIGAGRTGAFRFLAAIDRNVVSTIGARLAILAGGFVSSIVTARALTPAGRGEYFLVVTLAQTLAQFGTLGLTSSNTYFVARDRDAGRALVANSVWVAVAVGLVGALVIGFGRTGSNPVVWIATLLAPATLFYMLGSSLLVGLKRIGNYNVIQLLGNFGVLACLLTAAASGAGPLGFLIASTAGWSVTAVALLVMLHREVGATARFDLSAFRSGYGYASRAYLATLAGLLLVRANVFLLGALQPTAQVGYYSIASQISDVIGILPQSVALVLFPTLIAATRGRFKSTVRQALMVGALLAVGCTTIALVAEPFVRIVFGTKLLPAVPVLRWMLPGALCLGVTSVLSQYLAASGFPRVIVVIWIGGAVASAVLGYLLIPTRSIVGAAMALSATQAAVLVAIVAVSVAHAIRHEQSTN